MVGTLVVRHKIRLGLKLSVHSQTDTLLKQKKTRHKSEMDTGQYAFDVLI